MNRLTDKILATTTTNIAGKTMIHFSFKEASLIGLSFVAIISRISEPPNVSENKLVQMVKI